MVAVNGINHITFQVSNLDRSFAFYVDVLGCSPVVRWSDGAYLEAGTLWLALVASDNARPNEGNDYSHVAFSCAKDDFEALARKLRATGHDAWQDNRSEGDSYYFSDPDGHKLEIHVGDITSRLADMTREPWAEFEYFNR